MKSTDDKASIDITKQIHLVQTKDWNTFKQNYGTNVDKFEDIYFLVKKLPFSSKYMGYAPKVNFNVQNVDFIKLAEYCKQNNIAFIRFDVPNILQTTKNGEEWDKKLKKVCKKSSRNTFTKQNIYLDISKDIEELLKNMHQKRRYNIRYAQRNGVKVEISQSDDAFNTFYNLHSKTAKRQRFLTHSKKYFKQIQSTLKNHVYFVTAKVKNTPVTCWMIIIYDKTMYYVYGGSVEESRNLYPSDLVGFEAIKLGKNKGATMFDMWGAEKGKGFTDFKLKYGATLLTYLGSYDFVIDSFAHKQFNLMYQTFWKLQGIRKKLGI